MLFSFYFVKQALMVNYFRANHWEAFGECFLLSEEIKKVPLTLLCPSDNLLCCGFIKNRSDQVIT